jgi:cytochrome c5
LEEKMNRILVVPFVAMLLLMVAWTILAADYDPAAGKAVYALSCAQCHKSGMMGSPKVGEKAAWAPRIAKGMDAMVANATKGFKGAKGMMPPKGGNAKLTDAQVGNAVANMVSLSQ